MLDYLEEFVRQRKLLDGALEQLDDGEFFQPLGTINPVGVIMKHLAGNFVSRFTDFLTTDGEKPWRNREGEFSTTGESRDEIMRFWDQAWSVMQSAVERVQPADLGKVITIRGQELTVEEALLRSLTHFGYHVGQVVLLARFFRGDDWLFLSIPPEPPGA